jgi:hypothetical protein
LQEDGGEGGGADRAETGRGAEEGGRERQAAGGMSLGEGAGAPGDEERGEEHLGASGGGASREGRRESGEERGDEDGGAGLLGPCGERGQRDEHHGPRRAAEERGGGIRPGAEQGRRHEAVGPHHEAVGPQHRHQGREARSCRRSPGHRCGRP